MLLTLYGVSSRRTHVDMGMAAKNNRKPVKAWRVLMAILQEEGRFTWSDFGNYEADASCARRHRRALSWAHPWGRTAMRACKTHVLCAYRSVR